MLIDFQQGILPPPSRLIVLLLAAVCLSEVHKAQSADILVIGDTRLKPVVQMIDGIKKSVNKKVPVYSPSEIRSGKLSQIVINKNAHTVIALGSEAIREALTLPDSITVLYDMVILPLDIKRANTAGTYMGTPIKEYIDIIAKYLPAPKDLGFIASFPVLKALGSNDLPPPVITYQHHP